MNRFGRMCYIFAAVITFQAILLVLTNLGALVGEPDSIKNPSKVHLLIISTWRSGSSLVGQFFNQHPDVFYLKEPAWHVWKTMKHSKAHVLQMAVRDLIRSIYKCDMSVFDAYLHNSNVSDLFQWGSSRALCSPPACNTFSRNSIVTETKCRKHCGKSPFSKVQQSRNTYSHVVLQEFRIFDLKVLYSLLKDPTLNLKILHIVRDPRALAKSRKKFKFDLQFDNAVILGISAKTVKDTDRQKVLEEICRSQVDIYKTSTVHPPPFLEDHYMLLRYEDLVRDTLNMVKKMYAFAGLKLTNDLKMWIYEMVHDKGLQNSHPFIITSRDALRVSLEWRNKLTFEEVSTVQKICKDFMDFFRYQTLYSEDELMDCNLETVLPRNRDDFIWN